MERLDEHLLAGILQKEHEHRYSWAAQLVYGQVADCSCGIGYGSALLSSQPQVDQCMGLDIDAQSVKYAHDRFTTDKLAFHHGNIYELPFLDGQIDSFVSMETLEHLEQPQAAIREVKRVLAPKGIFIGSVPTASYESLCEEVYGPNQYHIQRFALADLKTLLSSHFQHYRIFTASVEVGTRFVPVERHGSQQGSIIVDKREELGSYLFVATNRDDVIDLWKTLDTISISFIPAMNMVEYDQERVLPLRKTIQDIENLASERDKAFVHAEEMIRDRDLSINKAEEMIRERDDVLQKAQAMIQERDNYIRSLEEKVRLWNLYADSLRNSKLVKGAMRLKLIPDLPDKS